MSIFYLDIYKLLCFRRLLLNNINTMYLLLFIISVLRYWSCYLLVTGASKRKLIKLTKSPQESTVAYQGNIMNSIFTSVIKLVTVSYGLKNEIDYAVQLATDIENFFIANSLLW